MDTDLLKTFLEVCKTRHFGKAAENLFLTQSAVSARIKQLEDELGSKLFLRNKNNIQPTTAGEKLLIHAQSILTSWNRIKLDLAIEDNQKTMLVLAGVPSLWDSYINRWLKKFINNNEEVVISCESLNSEIINRRLMDGSIDIAFTYDPPQPPKLLSLKTIPVTYVMVSAMENLEVDNALADNYIYVDWGNAFAATHASLHADMPVPRVRLSMGLVARYLILQCGGSAYLPLTMIRRDLEEKKLFKVNGADTINREAYIVVNNDNDRITGLKTELGK